jgi:hypothetical protein
MNVVEVVENPKRRKRRKMTAKQKRYFGKRRRRNPVLATLTNPRRRRSVSRRRSTSRRRRYRNPGLSSLTKRFDVNTLLYMSAGAIGVKMAPRYVQRFWAGMPTTGITGKLVQAGLAFGLSEVARMFVGRRAAQDVLNGGLVATMVDVLTENVLPMVGLGEYVYLTPEEIAPVVSGSGVGEYIYDAGTVPGVEAAIY